MKVYVIGGGPSGMMAAISAKKYHPESDVILLERNKVLGRKLRVTGGGRCNVTANVDEHGVIENTPKNGRFLYSALSNLNAREIISFFNDNGCPLKEEDHNRMFPASDKSIDIINTLKKVMLEHGVKILNNQNVIKIDNNTIVTDDNQYNFDKVILATGGRTLPGTGSDGSGYALAKSLNHQITELLPAEVPLVSNDTFIQDKVLQGLSFEDVNMKVIVDGKVKSNLTHDLLFTHFGLSGPAALRSSFKVQKYSGQVVKVLIDFFPGYSELDENHINAQKRLLDYAGSVSPDLFGTLKRFEMTVYDTRGWNHAFVTNGGVSLKDIDPKTFKSKLNDNVSFTGELLDMSSYTGGYNITSALVTGYTAGKYCL